MGHLRVWYTVALKETQHAFSGCRMEGPGWCAQLSTSANLGFSSGLEIVATCWWSLTGVLPWQCMRCREVVLVSREVAAGSEGMARADPPAGNPICRQ